MDFGELLDQLLKGESGFFSGLCHEKGCVEYQDDLIQDTALGCIRYHKKDPQTTISRGLIWDIARKRVCDYWRKRGRTPNAETDFDQVEFLQDARDEFEIVDNRDHIRHKLARLTPTNQRVLHDFYLEGKSAHQIAGEQGVKVETIRSRIKRAIQYVRR